MGPYMIKSSKIPTDVECYQFYKNDQYFIKKNGKKLTLT